MSNGDWRDGYRGWGDYDESVNSFNRMFRPDSKMFDFDNYHMDFDYPDLQWDENSNNKREAELMYADQVREDRNVRSRASRRAYQQRPEVRERNFQIRKERAAREGRYHPAYDR